MLNYFLGTSLPLVKFGLPHDIDLDCFLSNLKPKDQKSVEVILQVLSGKTNSLEDYLLSEIPKADGFLKNWLIDELHIRLNLASLRSQKMKQTFSAKFERDLELQDLFCAYENEPLAFAQALFLYRFKRVEMMIGLSVFTTDAELAYAVRFILNDQWMRILYDR